MTKHLPLLRWQFSGSRLTCPKPDVFSVLIGETDGKIAAMQGIIGDEVVWNGSVLSGGWLCNLIADLSLAGDGGFAMMKAATKLPLDMLMTAGINPKLFQFFPMLGCQTRSEMPRWIAVSPNVAHAAPEFAERFAGFAKIEGASPDGIIELEGRMPTGWDDFWQGTSEEYFGVNRSAAYLNWRYFEHPVFEYRALLSKASPSAIDGLAIFRVETVRPWSFKALRMVELIGAAAVKHRLLQHISYVAHHSGAMLSDISGDCDERDVFHAAGWSACFGDATTAPNHFQPFVLDYRPVNSAYESLSPSVSKEDLRRFSAMRADSDQDRPNTIT